MESEDEMDLELLKAAKADSHWLAQNYGSILKEHDNEFVAVKNCALVAHSPDF